MKVNRKRLYVQATVALYNSEGYWFTSRQDKKQGRLENICVSLIFRYEL